jgi:hypothetical protein
MSKVLALLLLIGLFDLLQIFLRILVKILLAGFAAQLDLLSLVRENVCVAHAAELFVRDDACFQWVCLRFGTLGIGTQGGEGSCQTECNAYGEQCLTQFHHTHIIRNGGQKHSNILAINLNNLVGKLESQVSPKSQHFLQFRVLQDKIPVFV